MAIEHVRSVVVEVFRLSEEQGGGWAATCAEFPGCMGDGETMAFAISDFGLALEGWLEADAERAPAA